MKFYQQHISKILAFLYFLGVGISYYLSIKHVDAKIAKLLNKNSDDGICGAAVHSSDLVESTQYWRELLSHRIAYAVDLDVDCAE